MLKRHSDTLDTRLEEVAVTQGWTTIRSAELRLWYRTSRVTKNVWRDITERFREIEAEHELVKDSLKVRIFDGNTLIYFEDEETLEMKALCE